MPINIVKYIANSGCCSRRQAEGLVRAGKAMVNGRQARLGEIIDEKKDEVKLNGKIIESKLEKIYIILNKPAGYTCTNRKFAGEKNVFDLFTSHHPSLKLRRASLNSPEIRGGEDLKNLSIVGRLDKNSRGLVLLTNDGDLAYKLTHPKFEHKKEYLVQLSSSNFQLPIKEVANNFKKGVDIGEGDGVVKAKEAEYLGNGKFKIILTEGKKRQIRRMFSALGLEVVDLKRASIGNLRLGNLAEGKWALLNSQEIKRIKI